MRPRLILRNPLILLVSQAGFEPATCPLGGGRAIQLRHWDFWLSNVPHKHALTLIGQGIQVATVKTKWIRY